MCLKENKKTKNKVSKVRISMAIASATDKDLSISIGTRVSDEHFYEKDFLSW